MILKVVKKNNATPPIAAAVNHSLAAPVALASPLDMMYWIIPKANITNTNAQPTPKMMLITKPKILPKVDIPAIVGTAT